MANIGNLAVTLALDAAAFTVGLGKSGSALKGFAESATKTFAVVGGIEAAFGGLATPFEWIKGGIDDLELVGRQSRELGLSVERLSGLEFAAGRAGDRMEQGLRHLGVKLNEAAEGVKATRDEFARFGLDGAQLAKGGLSFAIDKISDRMRVLGASGGGAALAMTLMSREGQQLIPFLEKGSAALHEMESAGGKLGAIATQEDVDRATGAAEEMDHLGSALKGIQRDVASGLAPIITVVAKEFQDWLKGIDIKQKLKAGFDWLESQIPVVVDGFVSMFKTFEHLGHKLQEMGDDIADFAKRASQVKVDAWGVHGAQEAFKGFGEETAQASKIRAAADELGDAAADKFGESLKKGIANALQMAKAPLDHPPPPPVGNRGPTDEMLKTLMEGPVAGLSVMDQYNTRLDKLKEAFAGATDGGIRFRNAVADLGESLGKTLNQKFVEYTNSAATGIDKLRAEFDNMTAAGVGADAIATNLGKDFEALTKKMEEIHRPAAMEEGSKEAYHAILQSEDRGHRPADVQEEILQLMKQEQMDRKEQLRQGRDLLGAMNRIFKKGN